MSRFRVLSFALLLLVSTRAYAQDASIVGIVTDESGGVLPGVTVTATSPALQVGSIAAVTDAHGEYRLTALPIGTYSATYTLSGFSTVRRSDIVLTASFAAKLDVQMKVGDLQETVTVTGASPVVDVVSTTSATRLTRETLDTIPTSRNGTVAFMSQAPGVRPQIDIGGDSITSPPVFHAFGQDNQPWQTIDGVVVSAAKSGTQGGIYWDFGNVEEAKVGTFGNQAEVPTRGVLINGIVKSGGNDFHGSGFYGTEKSGLQSDNIDDFLRSQGLSAPAQLQFREDYSGDLGGRIVRNKLWFYGGARRRAQRQNTLGCVQPTGDQCYSEDFQIFDTEKLSWQIDNSTKLLGFHTHARKTSMSSGSRLVAWESRNSQQLPSHVEKLEWQKVKGNNLLISVMGADMHWWSWFRGYGYNHVLTTDTVLGTTTGMSATDGDDPDDYNHQARGSVSWYKPDLLWGNHDIKFGAEYMRRRSDRPRSSRNRGPDDVAHQINNGDVPASYNGGNYQLQLRNGAAFRLIAFNYPATPLDLEDYTGAYLQDSWRMGSRLTLNLGVRFAHDLGFAPAQCRVAADPPGDVANPAQCFPEIQEPVWNTLAPRIHIAYDPFGDSKTVIKGGWGRFYMMRYTDMVQIANWNQFSQTTYIWHDLNNDRQYQPGEVNLDPNGPDFQSTTQGDGAQALGIVNPNEKTPGSDEYTASIERELMPNLALRVSGIYSRTFNQHRLLNVKRPYDVYNIPVRSADPGPDGVFNTADDPGTFVTYYDYAAQYAGARNQTPMLINDPDASQSFTSGEFALSRRFANRWQAYASLSFTKKHIPVIPNAGTATGLTYFVATFDPNAEINNSDNTTEWVARASGSYRLPYDVTLSANYLRQSGAPLRRTYQFTGGKQIPSITLPTEPLGSTYSLPAIGLLDLSLQKAVGLPGHQRAVLRVNVYNALNANTATAMTMLSGPNFGLVTNALLPRVAELSVAYSF
jgi:hypothetical protein